MNFTIRKSTRLFAAISVVVFFSLASALAENASDGSGLFKAKCAMCHGADGAGKTPVGQKLGIKDLHSAEVQQQSDSDLIHAIAEGKGKMPAFGKSLTADQIKALVAQTREMGKK
jgi:cytochrome c6